MDRTSRTKLQGALLALFALAAVDLQAEPWTPVDCADRAAEVSALREQRGLGDLAKERTRYQRALEGSPERGSLFVPHPFPGTTEQVLVDLEHAFRRLAERPSMPELDRALVRDLTSGHLRAEVRRVENWSALRCLSHRPTEHYFLVRLREPDGRERARVALKDSGVLASWVVYEAEAPELASPEQAKTLLAALGQSGLPVRDAQYVVADGLHRRCLAAAPCIAFRSGAATYLLGHGPVLYRLDDGNRLSVREQERILRQRGPLLGVDEAAPVWASVGFEFRRAHPVAGRP